MIIPAVMFIEMAMDGLKALPVEVVAHELKELRCLGEGRISDVKASVSGSSDFEVGYLLGLQTARSLLMTMPMAVSAGVDI